MDNKVIQSAMHLQIMHLLQATHPLQATERAIVHKIYWFHVHHRFDQSSIIFLWKIGAINIIINYCIKLVQFQVQYAPCSAAPPPPPPQLPHPYPAANYAAQPPYRMSNDENNMQYDFMGSTHHLQQK